MGPGGPGTLQKLAVEDHIPTQFVAEQDGKRQRVQHLQATPGGWWAVVAHGLPWHTTQFLSTGEWPTDRIAQMADAGFRLTHLGWRNGRYGLVFANNTGFSTQECTREAALSPQLFAHRFAQGWTLVALCRDAEAWRVVWGKGHPWAEQKVLLGPTFPEQTVRQWITNGWEVVRIEQYGGMWVVHIGRLPRGGGRQVLQVHPTGIPEGWLAENWGRGLRLQAAYFDVPAQAGWRQDNSALWTLLDRIPRRADDPEYLGALEIFGPTEEGFVILRRMMQFYLVQGFTAQAAELLERHAPRFAANPAIHTRLTSLAALLRAPAPAAEVHNLGPGVNSARYDYEVIPSADGRHLYFTGNGRPDGLGGEDIFIADLNPDGTAHNTRLLPGGINTANSNESANAISADGNTLFLFGNYENSLGSGDNYYTRRTADGWGPVEHFPAPINSPYFDSELSVSADGRALIFVSDRPGGTGPPAYTGQPNLGTRHGNTDIYFCLRQPDGSWGPPQNLGPTVNTCYAERTPFLHPDGRTLYFASSGHNAIGDLDVFVTRRLRADSWTHWSPPQNLGLGLNSISTDWGYRISTTGTTAFCAREAPDGLGEDDLYRIVLPDSLRPRPVATVRGRVLSRAGQPLAATLRWEDLATGEALGELTSTPGSGDYFLVLPLGSEYGFYADKDSFFPGSAFLDLRNIATPLDTTLDIHLAHLATLATQGDSIRLNNLFFNTASWELRRESYPELNRLVQVLKAYPLLSIRIEGHTDGRGDPHANQTLSENRAQAVSAYLQRQGINPRRLAVRGFGMTRPIAPNDTPEGQQLNRRVEIRFLR
jgi:outer membrane protein OmpA-like peptidoglycan-associated protein